MNHARQILVSLTLWLLALPAYSQVTVNPATLDFGTVQMGDSQQIRRAVVTNQSNAILPVSTRDRVGSVDFRIDRYVNLALKPGQQVFLDIAFRPLAPGSKSGYVRLVWPGGQTDVQLKAEVGSVAPPPPPPPPPPPSETEVTGKASGEGVDRLQAGQSLRLVGPGIDAAYTVTGVNRPEPAPDPGPEPNPQPVPGEGWFVSPTGSATGQGTRESPWSLEAAVNGTHRAVLAGGGTVWLTAGTYRKSPNPEGLGFRCVVGGTAARPLVFRAAPGQRVTIDGGWSFFAGSNHTWLRDVEVTVSDLVQGKPPFGLSGSWPEGAPNGGVSFYQSSDCKVINCIVQRNRQGINLWTEAVRAEAYGNLIYDNGWIGSDRSHGHGIYTQNPATTTKLIADNIITHTSYSRGWPDGRYGLHGYGERVAVTNITVEGNLGAGSNDAWLLDDGAPLGPSAGHHFRHNAVYGVRVRLGSRSDQPLEFRENIVAGELQISSGSEVTKSGNLISPPDPRPSNPSVILRPNRYDGARAHLMVVDWPRQGSVTADLSGWANAGERVRVMEPTAMWGAPIWSGAVPAGGVTIPTPDGARVVVLLKDGAPGLPTAPVREEAEVTPRLR